MAAIAIGHFARPPEFPIERAARQITQPHSAIGHVGPYDRPVGRQAGIHTARGRKLKNRTRALLSGALRLYVAG
jgi:hypothetical protein